MRKIILFLLCNIIFLGTGCSGIGTPEKSGRSANFSFLYRETPCGSIPVDVFDSSENALIHTPLGETRAITIPLRLTNDELDAIYQKAIEYNFFKLPAEILPPANSVHIMVTPAATYELTMTNGANINSVYWKRDMITDPLFKEADQFSRLMGFIREIIRSHQEYKQVPESSARCM